MRIHCSDTNEVEDKEGPQSPPAYEQSYDRTTLDGSFPHFFIPDHYLAYKRWQRGCISIYVVIFIIVFVVIPNMATRYSWQWFGSNENSWHLLSQIFAFVVTILIFPVFLGSFFFLRRYADDRTLSARGRWIHRQCTWILYEAAIEDWLCYITAVCTISVFLGRVTYGPCPEGAELDIWDSQLCNPVAMCHSFPHDSVLMMYVPPMVMQAVFRGISLQAMAVCYLVSGAAVGYAIYFVQGATQMYTLLYMTSFIAMSYCYERWMRIWFIRTMLEEESNLAEAAAQLARLELSREQEIEKLLQETAQANREREQATKVMLATKEKEMMRSIMGNVTHDLKTPLHALDADIVLLRQTLETAVQQILSDPTLSPTVTACCTRLLADSISLYEDIEGTLKYQVMAINRSQDYVKASSNIALTPKLETICLSEVVQKVRKYIGNQQAGRSVTIHPPPEEMCEYIVTDSLYLSENMLSLLSNAIKYSDQGGVIDARIKVVCDEVLEATPLIPPTAMVLVTVADTGIGISDAAKGMMFQPFQQAQRAAGGTGLGLYSLSKRVEALGGLCGVRDREDGKQGSVFWFTFPYRPDHEHETYATAARLVLACRDSTNGEVGGSASVPATEASSRVGEKPSLPPLRILLTDDVASVLKVTSRFLLANKHSVMTAENGSQSLERLKEYHGQLDLLITDLQMPIMDGFESVRRYRAWEEAALTPDQKPLFIVGMSANNDDESVREALAVGMNTFITKPFNYDRLEDLIIRNKTEVRGRHPSLS